MKTLADRVVIIGSGVAGLFAARVLSDYVREVVVVERDAPPGTDPRGGVPQGHHVHGLMPGGFDAMCEWFPGFADRLERAGGLPCVLGRDATFYIEGGASYSGRMMITEPSEQARIFVMSRPFLEHHVREEVSALTGVSFRYGEVVASPLVSSDAITGVVMRSGEQLTADLVVDASGRQPLTVRWLEQLGYESAHEDLVHCGVRYASAQVEPPHFDAFSGTSIMVMPNGQGESGRRLGFISKLEGGRWIATLAGRYDDAPPTEWEAFLAYGGQFEHDVWHRLIKPTRPLGRVMPYHLPRSVRRRYELLDRFPDGLLPVGDASCFFNPTYGQGMSSAAAQCRALSDVLARRTDQQGLKGVAAEFLPAAANWVRGPWAAAAMADLSHPLCNGDQPVEEQEDFHLLLGLAQRAAVEPEVERVFNGIWWMQLPLSAVRAFA